MSRTVEILGEIIVIGVSIYIFFFILLTAQVQLITNTCLQHPNETLSGDFVVNCSEWLKEVKP